MSKLYPFPVLSLSSFDYIEQCKQEYRTNIRLSADTVEVEHILSGSSLVAKLVRGKHAKFCTTVTVKGSVFRHTEACDNFSAGADLNCKQQLPVQALTMKDYKVFVKPGVVASDPLPDMRVRADMGLSDFYSKGDILRIPQWSWLADGGWWSPPPDRALFVTKKVDDIGEQQFRAVLDGDVSMRIIISMGEKMYDEVNRNGPCRAPVILASLTLAFQELRAAYKRIENVDQDVLPEDSVHVNDVRFLESARYLHAYLQKEGLPVWTDGRYNASEAASKYKPVVVDTDLVADEDTEV